MLTVSAQESLDDLSATPLSVGNGTRTCIPCRCRALGLGTLIQHAVFNHLTDLLTVTAFLRAGDFSNARHDNDRSSIESVAKTLVGLGVQDNSNSNSAIGPHMPKPKQRVGLGLGHNGAGGIQSTGLGRCRSASSTVSSMTPRKCELC